MKRWILAAVCGVVALGLLFYPLVGEWMNEKYHSDVETTYTAAIEKTSDTALLQIEDGKDYVTLVTCTPFGVNTHRLLVRGYRVPYELEQAAEAAAQPVASSWTRHYLTGLAAGFGTLAVAGGAYYLIKRRKQHG